MCYFLICLGYKISIKKYQVICSGGSISRSINDDPFQIGGENTTNVSNADNVTKSLANVLLSVDK